MNFVFNFDLDTINNISKLLEKTPDIVEESYTWSFGNISFSIFNNVKEGDISTALISIQTIYGYYELHNVTGYTVFPPDELIFFAMNDNKVSSLILTKSGGVSLYANISKDILSSNLTQLEPALMLAALQLSIINK